MTHELAQLNTARPKYAADAPEFKDFMDGLDPVNAVADAADGFVWRLQDDSGNATALRLDGDDSVMVNLSVWRDAEALAAFMYEGLHRTLMSRRREWFEPLTEAGTVLWWVEAGVRPTVAEAGERLAHLRAHGPTPYAFTLRTPFPRPGE
ncbi:DUF3291 domain-containing protein [Streptomyces sp. NPDC046866]|uniref:DUF3291 domain-containing protein n=1 Tax=Streptomyces sp. NPDC046866 TaxID=3154921 RepID=UPI003456D731